MIDPGGHKARINDVMFTRDGRHLVSAGDDKETHRVGGKSNVRLVRQGKAPVDVSECKDVHCGQPSLSFAGDRVVFVKASSGTP